MVCNRDMKTHKNNTVSYPESVFIFSEVFIVIIVLRNGSGNSNNGWLCLKEHMLRIFCTICNTGVCH